MVTFSSVAPDHVACGLGGIAAGVLILLHGSLSWLSRLVRFVKMKSRELASSPGGAGLTAFVMSGKNSAMRRLRKSRLDLPAHTTNGLVWRDNLDETAAANAIRTPATMEHLPAG